MLCDSVLKKIVSLDQKYPFMFTGKQKNVQTLTMSNKRKIKARKEPENSLDIQQQKNHSLYCEEALFHAREATGHVMAQYISFTYPEWHLTTFQCPVLDWLQHNELELKLLSNSTRNECTNS